MFSCFSRLVERGSVDNPFDSAQNKNSTSEVELMMVDLTGFEPVTSALQMRRSTS